MDHQSRYLKSLRNLGLLLCALIACGAYLIGLGQGIDNYLQDQQLARPQKINPRIVILGIDETSLEKIGRWPWPRTVLADLVTHISAGKPLAIGVDVLLSEPSPIPEQDARLAAAFSSAGNVVLPVAAKFSRQTKVSGDEALSAISLNQPLAAFQKGTVLGHINVIPDPSDGVVRRLETKVRFEGNTYTNFAAALAQTAGYQPILNTRESLIDFSGKPGSYGYISIADVLSGTVPSTYFKDSFVLIGPVALGLVEDAYTTPLDRQTPMAGIEIHANSLQCYLENRFKQEAIFWQDGLLILGVMFLSWLASRRFSPLLGGLSCLGIGLGYLYSAKYLYGEGLKVSLFYPILGIALIYLWLQAVGFLETYLEKRRITMIFGKYVAPEIVTEILKLGEDALKLGGQRKDVAVLFVDVRGFTPLSERTDPEVVVEVLNAYLSLTTEAIFKSHGTLDKFIGDATMAVFNAPLDLPDYPMAAIKAALEMRAQAEPLHQDLLDRYGVSLHFGIGVHLGPAVVGNIGSQNRMDYTAIGDTVNTSARLESNAKAGEILVGEATKCLLEDRVHFEYVKDMQLKGKAEPMPVYNVVGLKEESEDV